MGVKLIYGYEHPKEVGILFSEYTQMLIRGDSSFREYLEIQNYDREVEDLKVKYGLPKGRLYLAFTENKLAGCIGLKMISEVNCELKRLYVRPKFRGRGIGDYLIKQILNDAVDIGYSYVLLDTLPFLKSALHLYKRYGFYEIDNYNNSPMDNSIFLKYDLVIYL